MHYLLIPAGVTVDLWRDPDPGALARLPVI